MIPEARHSAWLADADAHRAALEHVKTFSAKWARHPLITELEREIAECPDESPDALLAAARRFMDRVQDIDELVKDMISGSRRDPYFRVPLDAKATDIQTGLLLFENEHLAIVVAVSSLDRMAAKKLSQGNSGSIGFGGRPSLFRFVRSGGATLSFWEIPPIADQFVALEASRARLTGCRRIADGEELILDGRSQSFVIEHAEGEMVFFQAQVRRGGAPVTAEYDRQSLDFFSASSTDEAASRTQMLVSLLRVMDRADAVPAILDALEYPQFYTRWHIMRELLALDAEAALPALRRMAEADPHPEIRETAGRTLAMFFPSEVATPGGSGAAAG